MNYFVTIYQGLYKNSLYRNSFWLMAGAFVMAGVGFFYWLIAARLYSAEQIGLAATFLSVGGVVNLFGMFGFGTTLMRYLPTSKNKEKKINTAFTIVSVTAVVAGVVYLIGMPIFTDKLLFITESLPLLAFVLLFFPFNMMNTLTDSVFIAFREAQWVFVSNSTQSITKLIILMLLPTLGFWGIVGSNIVAVVLTFCLCLFIISRHFKIRFRPHIDSGTVLKVRKYAFGSYLSALMSGLPTYLLPIIITHRISPEQTAYFYMPNMIASLLIIIPSTISRSYFTEGSHANKPGALRNPLLFSYAIIVPVTIAVILLGQFVLSLFGHNYASGGYTYLVLISISVVISVANFFLSSRLMIQHRLKTSIFVNSISSFLYLGLAWVLTAQGIEGVGMAAIISQIVSVLTLLALK